MLTDNDVAPGQILITEVFFFSDDAARRLARWLNRNWRAKQAAKRGTHVIVGAAPRRVMDKAYLAIGAMPCSEHIR